MITVLAIILCGGLVVLGVICLIVSVSSQSQKCVKYDGGKRLSGKETKAMVKYSRNEFDLVTLPEGETALIPKRFDPHFIMDQLAEIQHSPNVFSAYVNKLTAKFQANQQISFIKKMEEYYIALASGMEAQLKIMDLQDEFENVSDIENKALKKQLYRGKLKRDLAKVEAQESRYRDIDTQQKTHEKRSDPYSRAKRQVEGQIANRRGRLDAIKNVEREQEAELQHILRGRDESELSAFEREEIMKIKRYYGNLMDQF